MDKQLPKIKPKAEAQITDGDIKKYGPDLSGQRDEMAKDIQLVHKVKPQLDQIMQPVADATQTSMSSRIKDPRQIIRKTIQKRMEDRTYDLSDINDLLGYRFTYVDPKQEKQVIAALEQLAKQGKFIIHKEQERNKADYHAWHADILFPLPNGQTIRCEVQVLNTKDEAQAALGHDLHFQYAEDVPKPKQKQLNKQMDTVKQLPPIKQKAIADTMINAHKITKDSPLPSGFGSKVVTTIAKA